MQYRLRTLLILATIGPPVLAGGWFAWERIEAQIQARHEREISKYFAIVRARPLTIERTGVTVLPDDD
jgi:hypothetical protein